MKTKLGILIFLLAAALAHAQTNNLTALLQQGLFEEQANRNLDAAIADYQALARQFDKDRQLAATAVFRLGECYRMQGKTNEAALEYQRILRDFSDQTTLATLSRQNIAGIGGGTTTSQPVVSKASSASSEAVTMATQLSAIEQLKTNPVVQAHSVQALFPDDSLKRMLLNLPKLEKQEAEVKAGKTFQELGFFSFALGPDPIPDQGRIDLLRINAERDSTNLLADTHAELQKQLAWISDRVGFIIQIQKAKLAVLQTMAGINASPNISAETPPVTDDEEKEIARIQTMIRNSPDLINARVPGGEGTPLQKAAAAGWIKVATYLLDHGADVNADRGGALYAAAKAGNRAMVELLLSRGADVNSKENTGQTPLHVAVQNGFQAVVEVLLANKADVNAQNGSGVTPLFMAAGRDNPKIVSLLLEHKADVNASDQSGATPLMNAARSGHPEIVRLLLAAGANPNVETSRDNNGSRPMPAGFSGRTALSFAAESGSPEMVKMLLAAKADPNGGKLDAPLLCAIYNNNLESAELLLQAGAKPNSLGAFDFSGQTGSVGSFGGGFGGGGGPVSGRGGRGGFGGSPRSVTPLSLAISENQLPMVELLLKFKADPNEPQADGRPLLFNALSNTNILEALLDAGANANARMDARFNNRSLLQMAAEFNPPESVALLLQHGASPNATDANNATALHAAANSLSDEKVFTLLLDHNANPNLRDYEGKTPLDIIKDHSHDTGYFTRFDSLATQKAHAEKLIALLRERGALDVLPDWDRITVSRPSARYSMAIFYRGTNDWNQITLFDLLGVQYELLTASTASASRRGVAPYGGANAPVVENSLAFPDFSKIVIHRPSASGTNWQDLKINLARARDSGDCAGDMALQFGDVVEIPETDHVINEPWRGLSTNELFTLKNCLARHLQINVNGQTTNVTVAPSVQYAGPFGQFSDGFYRSAIGLSKFEPFMLWPVLENSKLLLASSDLSRVTVKRRDDATGKTREWTVDCSNPNSPPAFWLRDGDVIEVPGKP